MSALGVGTLESPHGFRDLPTNLLQTRDNGTSDPLLTSRKHPSAAAAILAWLEAHAADVLIQEIPAGGRPKNRVVLTYRGAGSEIKSVGGPSIAGAVWRARIRLEAARAAGREQEHGELERSNRSA